MTLRGRPAARYVSGMRTVPLLFIALVCGAIPCAAQDRWQLTLHSDTVLWDLELVGLRGDTLLVHQTDSDATLRVPLMQIDELRLIAKAEKRANVPDALAMERGLMGTGDPVFRLTLRDRAERIEIVRQILATRGPQGP